MAHWLTNPSASGVYHLTDDARQLAESAAAAGLAVYRIDIGHAHDKQDFIRHIAGAMRFPASFGGNWDALADSLKDLSWTRAPGWLLLLEKSKHFCAGHPHEFKEAMDIMAEAAQFWRGEGKSFWALIGGPDGWQSGWPAMPAN